jgi:hypothetical protein
VITGWKDTMWANGPMEPASEEMFALPSNVN